MTHSTQSPNHTLALPLVALLSLLACAPQKATVRTTPTALHSCVLQGKNSIAGKSLCVDDGEDTECSWSFGLRFAQDLPVFGRLEPDEGYIGIKSRLTFPVGSHKRAVKVELDGDKLTLRTFIVDNNRYLFSRKPLRLGEAVFALGNVRLLWFEGSPGTLLVGVDKVSSFEPVGKTRVKVPCGELSLDAGWEDDVTKLIRKMAGLGPIKRKVVLHAKKRIPLYSMTEKKLQGTIYIDKVVPNNVALIQETADRSLILAEFHFFALVGWIPNEGILKAAVPKKHPDGAHGVGGLGNWKKRGGTCSSAKALYVKYQGEHHEVGSLHAGKRFFVDGQSSRWTRISLERTAWFQMTKGYFLYVETDALNDCVIKGRP